MTLNQAGVDLIKQFEGCQVEVYKDVVGLLTVGWGHRTNLPLGVTITQELADTLLQQDLAAVQRQLHSCLTTSLTDNQFSALVSFVYNLGINRLEGSTLLTKINSGELTSAADEFLKWDHAGGIVVLGLLRRRSAERTLFLLA